MILGSFSISLTVKDIRESVKFYSKLGFEIFMGSEEHKWVIMSNENTKIGLFENMFDANIMTFNPGWSKDAEKLEKYDDIRDIKKHCEETGIEIFSDNTEKHGPCSFMLRDPDGNIILFDQHI